MSVKTQGTALYMLDPDGGSGSATVVKICAVSITGVSTGEADQVDITTLCDQVRKFMPGLSSPEAISMELQFDPSDETHVDLWNLKKSGDTRQWAIGFADGTDDPAVNSGGGDAFDFSSTSRSFLDFSGYVSNLPLDFNQNEVVSGTMSLQISGDISLSSASDNTA